MIEASKYYTYRSDTQGAELHVPGHIVQRVIDNALERSKETLFDVYDTGEKLFSRIRFLNNWNYLAYIKNHPAWTVEIFDHFATADQKELLQTNQTELRRHVKERIAEIPKDTTYQELKNITKSVFPFIENALLLHQSRNDNRAFLLNWIYVQKNREEIPFYREWYGFKLPDLAKEILEKNPYISSRIELGGALSKELDQHPELVIHENSTPGLLIMKVHMIMLKDWDRDIAVILHKRAMTEAEKNLVPAAIAKTEDLNKQRAGPSDLATAFDQNSMERSGHRTPPTGGKAHHSSKPNLWKPPSPEDQ